MEDEAESKPTLFANEHVMKTFWHRPSKRFGVFAGVSGPHAIFAMHPGEDLTVFDLAEAVRDFAMLPSAWCVHPAREILMKPVTPEELEAL